MRTTTQAQLQLGELDIANIKINPRSRDDIPQLLRGLQYLYVDLELRQKIFQILETLIPAKISTELGRPGMELWKILVMGCLRLNLNCDYDRLQELVNHHKIIRQMLGHGFCDDEQEYSLQTLKDNIQLFTPEILDEINQVVVNAGLKLKKKDQAPLTGRCDSFVVETNVHYPTDINLLFDATRKVIQLTADYAQKENIDGWRQYQFNVRQIKRAYRKAQQCKRSTSKNEEKKKKQKAVIIEAHKDYIELSKNLIYKSELTLGAETSSFTSEVMALEIKGYIEHAQRQISQIETRVIKGVTIPHEEKVFSIFQPHTEWISKGKVGVPVELGLRVCILESEQGYILNHRVMEKEVDNQIAVEIVANTQARFPYLTVCSFDKGFHSPENQIELSNQLERVILPKKGRCNKKEKEKESSPEFRTSKRKHSAVESGINALEIHGLDLCPDHGIKGFKRYVALAIVGRNIQKLGSELIKASRQQVKLKRGRDKLAA